MMRAVVAAAFAVLATGAAADDLRPHVYRAQAAMAVCDFNMGSVPTELTAGISEMEKHIADLKSDIANFRESCGTLFVKYGPLGTVRPGLIRP